MKTYRKVRKLGKYRESEEVKNRKFVKENYIYYLDILSTHVTEEGFRILFYFFVIIVTVHGDSKNFLKSDLFHTFVCCKKTPTKYFK